MARTRTATPLFGTIALVLVGGAVATVAGTILMFAAIYETDVLVGFRHSTAYYALLCAVVGFLTAIGLMMTRPRGPVAPIVAAISGYVALFVGVRTGILSYAFTHGSVPSDFVVEVLKPHFDKWDLLAPVVAGAIGGLRVLMVAGSLQSSRQPGGHLPQPGQPFAQPGQPFAQPGQPFAQPGGYAPPHQQPAPGQPHQPPASGQPYQPPAQPNQPPAQPY
ncbi:hypothetical protein GCM10022254_56580 [Actinomadura meridiana]|uniref:Uncharacterized protein n=1 Tax=Actinomadura meridiana TaxID=559626 RepID=A0ABP8CG47_9ACTN